MNLRGAGDGPSKTFGPLRRGPANLLAPLRKKDIKMILGTKGAKCFCLVGCWHPSWPPSAWGVGRFIGFLLVSYGHAPLLALACLPLLSSPFSANYGQLGGDNLRPNALCALTLRPNVPTILTPIYNLGGLWGVAGFLT
jgi:hypothetical protein